MSLKTSHLRHWNELSTSLSHSHCRRSYTLLRTAVVDFVATERERIVSKNCIFFSLLLHLRRRTTSFHSFSLLLLVLLSLRMQTKLVKRSIPSTQVFEYRKKKIKENHISYNLFSFCVYLSCKIRC